MVPVRLSFGVINKVDQMGGEGEVKSNNSNRFQAVSMSLGSGVDSGLGVGFLCHSQPRLIPLFHAERVRKEVSQNSLQNKPHQSANITHETY